MQGPTQSAAMPTSKVTQPLVFAELPDPYRTPLQFHSTETARQSRTPPALAQLQAPQAITRRQCEGALPNQSDGVRNKREGVAHAL